MDKICLSPPDNSKILRFNKLAIGNKFNKSDNLFCISCLETPLFSKKNSNSIVVLTLKNEVLGF